MKSLSLPKENQKVESAETPDAFLQKVIFREYPANTKAVGFFDHYFKQHQVLPLYYNEVTTGKTDEKLLDFLEVPRHAVTSDVRKHPVVKRATAAENYYALKEKFRNTRWSVFFESE